jgi:DNA repair photolyase
MEKQFKGKAIYQPSGKAAEYSSWAVNFYNGCSAECDYCYNRHGITANVLGGDKPVLKKSLRDEDSALEIFIKEADQNRDELKGRGLFFNFVSDPFLKETIVLNMAAIQYCLFKEIPVKVLTKQTWWLDEFLHESRMPNKMLSAHYVKNILAFGFTLTGHDEQEPKTSPTIDRTRAMKTLHDAGYKTWASIEPIIEVEDSLCMIEAITNRVNLVKIGLLSGKKYEPLELTDMIPKVDILARIGGFKVYYKDSFLKQAKVSREELPENCVTRDYNMFNN